MGRRQVPNERGPLPGVSQLSRAVVADASHDLNNWLGVILGNVTLLAPSVGGDPVATRRLDAIGQAVHVAADIIRVLNEPPDAAVRMETRGPGLAEERAATGPRPARVALVIDDEKAILVLVRRVLEAEGITVVAAADGTAALLALASLPRVDAVLLDLTMPGARSSEVIGEVRRLDPGTGIVVMSGHDRRALEDEVPDHARIGFLQKPFDIDELVATIVAAMPEPTRTADPSDPSQPEARLHPGTPPPNEESTCIP